MLVPRVESARDIPIRASWLDRWIAVLVACGALASALAFVPSVEVYEDSNNCIGHAGMELMFAMVGGHLGARSCDPQWVLTKICEPVDHSLGVSLYFAILLLPGLLMRYRPSVVVALSWLAWVIGGTYVMLAAMFDLSNLFKRVVELPCARAFDAAACTFVVGTILVSAGWTIFTLFGQHQGRRQA